MPIWTSKDQGMTGENVLVLLQIITTTLGNYAEKAEDLVETQTVWEYFCGAHVANIFIRKTLEHANPDLRAGNNKHKSVADSPI